MVDDAPDILVVDDTEGYRDLYSLWLAPEHDVRTAANGPEALEELDDRIDIVLLDREMPGPDGVEVARSIEVSPHDPFVVMVSSMQPDFELIEQPVEEYIQKPVEEDDIQGVIDTYRAQQAYLEAVDELFSLMAKVAAIETHTPREELADDEEYARLTERVEKQRAEVSETLVEARSDWETTIRACMKDVGEPAQTDPPNGLG